MTTDIVTDALTMAWFRKRPAAGLMHYSDRDSQYASHAFQRELEKYGMLVSAPQDIRERLWKANPEQCIAGCAHLRILGTSVLLQTLATTLRLLAKLWLMLAAELKKLDAALDQLTSQHAPRLREQFGVGPQTAAILLAVAGDNPERLHSEAALAALCGVSPLQASSGKIIRHRLNRGGDRSAINALWTIAMVRMRSDPQTRAYV
jgi:transposase